MTERPNADQDPANAHEAAERAKRWKVDPADLPTTVAMTTGDPQKIFDFYDEASQRAVANETQEGTNTKPAITESTEEGVARDKRQGKSSIDRLTGQVRERIKYALGGAGIRFA